MTEQASKQPTLYLIVGLPGSGKTTKAKEIELEQSALRFTPDEWIISLYGNDLDRPQREKVRDPMEQLQWQVAQRALLLKCNVVLDWGFWSLVERTKYRKLGEDLGVEVKVISQDLPLDELWERITKRPESLKGTLHITREELEHWSTRFEPPSNEEML